MTAASMPRVPALSSRRAPHGFDALVYRLGLGLAHWAHHRAQSQYLDREQIEDLLRRRAARRLAETERERARTLGYFIR